MAMPEPVGSVSDDTMDFPYPLEYRYPVQDVDAAVDDAARRLTRRALPRRRSSRGRETSYNPYTSIPESADRKAVSVEDFDPLVNLWNASDDKRVRAPASAGFELRRSFLRLAGFAILVCALLLLVAFSLSLARHTGFIPETYRILGKLSLGLGEYLLLAGVVFVVLVALILAEKIAGGGERVGDPRPREHSEEQPATVVSSVAQAVRDRKLSLVRSSHVVKGFSLRQKHGGRARPDALVRVSSGYFAGGLVLLGAPLLAAGFLAPALGRTSDPRTMARWGFPNVGLVVAVFALVGLAGVVFTVVGTLSPPRDHDVEAAERRLGAAYLVSSDIELAEGVNAVGARAALSELQEVTGGKWNQPRRRRLSQWLKGQSGSQLALWAISGAALIASLALTVNAAGLPAGEATLVASLLVFLSCGLVAMIQIAVDNRVLAHSDAICHCVRSRALDSWMGWPCLLLLAVAWAMLPTSLVVGADSRDFALLSAFLHAAVFAALLFGTGIVHVDRRTRRLSCVRHHTYLELRGRLEESIGLLAELDHTSRRRRPRMQAEPDGSRLLRP